MRNSIPGSLAKLNKVFSMSRQILILPGDGIGPEIMAQAERILASQEVDLIVACL